MKIDLKVEAAAAVVKDPDIADIIVGAVAAALTEVGTVQIGAGKEATEEPTGDHF